MQSTFNDLISTPEKTFLKLFTPSFASDTKAEGSSSSLVANPDLKMSKIPTSGSKASTMSRLAVPGSLSKRPREGSMDLEAGMEAKKSKTETAEAPASNLSKSKSKSMMSIAPAGESKCPLPPWEVELKDCLYLDVQVVAVPAVPQ